MPVLDHPERLISWRAALVGGMCGIGVVQLFGTVNFVTWYWLLFLNGTPSQQIYATVRDYSSPWLLASGACISVGGALLAGFVAVRSGAASRLQALVAGLVCLAFEILAMAYPSAPHVPPWLVALTAMELIVGSLLGGVLAVRIKDSIQRSREMSVSGNLGKGLRTIGHGFLLGIGFCIVLAVFVAVAEFLVQRQIEHATPGMEHPEVVLEAKIKDLELIDVQENKSGDRDYIIGTIKNNGAGTFRHIEVEADLFLAGKFVDKYSTYQSAELAPGATAYFKIECGCKSSGPAEHDSFKTAIASAY